MCGGFVGDLVSAGNPVKVLSDPIGSAKKMFKATQKINVGSRVNDSLGIGDKFADIAYRKKDAADAASAAADANIRASRKAELDAYNNDVIAQKRRRKASSVLARAGSGVTDSANSVLAAAATYGKTTTGA